MAERKGRTRARERGRDPEAPRPSMGGQMCEWIEAFFAHGPGPLIGEPFRLHGDAERFIWQLAEVHPPGHPREGQMAFREAALVEPKQWAKSELAAAWVACQALGPSRFDRWDANGNPVARPVELATIPIYANDEEQARNTFRPLAYALHPRTARPELLEEYGEPDVGRDPESATRIILPEHRGTVAMRSTRARSKEGGLPTAVAVEEPHLWVLPTLIDLWRTEVRGVLKVPGAQVLHSSNWFAPGQGSVLEQLKGDADAGADGVLWFGTTLPAGILDPMRPLREQSRATLRKALRAVYGTAASFVDIEAIIDLIRRPSTKESEALRFYLNAEATLDRSWTDRRIWTERDAPRGARIEAKERVGLGFVGTERCVALVACRLSDRLIEPVRVWEGDEPSRTDVDAEVEACFARWKVERLLANPWSGWHFDVDRWSQRWGEKVALRFPVREDARMAVALENWDTAVVTGQLRHVGDEVLSRHVLRCAVRKTKAGDQLEPMDPRDPITAAQAAVLAHQAAVFALATVPAEKPKPVAGPSASAMAQVNANPLRSNGRLKI